MREFVSALSHLLTAKKENVSPPTIFDALATKFQMITPTFNGEPLAARAAFPIQKLTQTAVYQNTGDIGRSFVYCAETFYPDDFLKNVMHGDESLLPDMFFVQRNWADAAKSIVYLIHPSLVIAVRENVDRYGTVFLGVSPSGRLTYRSTQFPDPEFTVHFPREFAKELCGNESVLIVQPCGSIRLDEKNFESIAVPSGFELSRYTAGKQGCDIDINWERYAIDVIVQITPDFRSATGVTTQFPALPD